MSTDLSTWDRYFRYGLMIAAIILGGLDTWFDGQNVWIKSAFVIAIAGLVGYFTNYLAIKMLFQPKRGQVLGWRGLVPQNQAQIARSLSESVQEQLLSPDIILAYIRDRKLIETSRRNLASWADKALQTPVVRRRITELLVDFLSARGPSLLEGSLDFAESSLKGLARNPQLIENYWQKIRVELLHYLQSPEYRTLAAENIRKLLQQKLPEIAEWIDRALEDFLAHKRGVGSLGRGLKNLVSFDQDAILELLQRFTDDPELSDEFMNSLDAVMDGIQRELSSDTTQALIQEHLESWVGPLAEASRKTLLPGAIEQLDGYLKNADNWKQIEDGVMRGIQWLSDRALEMLESEAGQAYVRTGIERAVNKLNVTELVEEQVMKLDTDELEKMVLDNTGGNLTVIQVLGGALGVIAGTVQVHILFAIPIATMVGVVWIAYSINEYRHRKDA